MGDRQLGKGVRFTESADHSDNQRVPVSFRE